MRRLLLALAALIALTGDCLAAFGIFQTSQGAPTADWVRDITQAPYSATCNGTADDRAAFAAFNTDAQAQSALGNSVMMVIPSGKTCMLKSSTTRLGDGVRNYTIYAYGASLSDGGTGTMLFGGQAQYGGGHGNEGSVRLSAQVNPGDTCVSLPTPSPAITISNITLTGGTWRLTVSDSTGFTSGQILRISNVTASNKGTLEGLQFINVISSGAPGTIDVQPQGQLVNGGFSYTSGGKINDYTGMFVVGQYALIGGLDVQAVYRSGGFGAPSNPAFYEYAKIASVNLAAASNQVCFESPLTGTYKTTWPNYDVGGNLGPDPGGSATIWPLDSTWDTVYRVYGLTVASPTGQHTMVGRSFYLQDVSNTGANGVIPSTAGSWTAVNASWVGNFEIDKINGPVSCTGCTFNIFQTQSRSSATTLTLTNTTVTQMNGTPAVTVMNNVTMPTQFQVGPAGYGTSTSFSGSTISTPTFSYNSAGATGSAGLQAEPGWSISGDTISVDMTVVTTAQPWAVEGSYICWYGNGLNADCEDIAKIIAVGQSGNNATIQLNKSYAGNTWPAVSGTQVRLRNHPMPSFTCTTCTGSAQLVGMAGASAGAPLYSYWSQAYSGTLGSATQSVFKVWGKITSFSMDVTNAGGGTSFRLSEFNNWPMQAPQFTTVSGGWNSSGSGPSVNAAIAGNRTITLSGTYSVSGTQSGDAGWTAADTSFMWLGRASNSGPKYNAAPSGCPGASCPSVTITIQTDQSIP